MPTIDTSTTPNTITAWTCAPSVLNADGSFAGNIPNSVDGNLVNDFPYFQELSINPVTGARGNAYRHYYSYDSGLFVQDDWKVSPRFTLNLGLRWERYGAPREQHAIIAQFPASGQYAFDCLSPANTTDFVTCMGNVRTQPAQSMWNTRNYDFGPRIGFAWDVFGDQKTSLRAGYGIFYDRIFDNVWSNGAWNPPFYGLIDADATGGDTIFYSRPPAVPPSFTPGAPPDYLPLGARVSVRTMEQNLKDSSDQSLYFGLERQVSSSLALTLNYQGSLGRHLPVLMNWNRYDGDRYNATLTLDRPNSHYTGFNYRSNNVTSNYNALVFEARKHFSHSVALIGGYTWGRLMDFGSDLFSGSTSTGQFSQPYYFLSNSRRSLEYGPGAFDHAQAFKLNITYELPFMKDQRGFAGKFAGGWQLSGFYQLYTGHPIEVYNGRARFRGNVLDANSFLENIGGDYNLDGVNNDHPDYVGGSASAAYSHANPADGIFKDNNLIGCGYVGQASTNTSTCNDAFGVTTPNSLFVNPPWNSTGIRYGGLGRNLFRGPAFNGLDGGIFKNVAINERWKLQIRIEALNLPNHPNFDGTDTNLNSFTFGRAQCTIGGTSSEGPCTSDSAPARRLQVGARLTF